MGPKLRPIFELALRLGSLLEFVERASTTRLLVRATLFRAFSIDTDDECLGPLWEAADSCVAPAPATIATGSSVTALTGLRAIELAVAGSLERPATIEPISVQPITSALEAKQLLQAYLAEIGASPDDLELRHHLLLGSFGELLARSKLPPATQDRLRAIVAKAEKDGPTKPIVELMMAALARMTA